MRSPLQRVWSMLLFLGLATTATAHGLPPIPVDVLAPSDVTDSLVRRICTEADMIWAPAGVTFEWHRVVATTSVPWRLHVTIEDRRKAAEGSAALGWVTVRGERVEPSIHLSRVSVEDLFLRTAGHNNAPRETHDALVGRALGRALSHELGHYLLKVKGHTAHGLMRATWPSNEFFAMNRSGFELTASERDAAVQIVP